jgi:predicted alpha/beta-fold hydrolase
MEVFASTIALYRKYQNYRRIVDAKHIIIHEKDSNINCPSLAYSNLYYNTNIQTNESIKWSKLIGNIIKKYPHSFTLLEMIDYYGQLQTALMFTCRNIFRLMKNIFQIHSTHYQREILHLSDNGNVALDWVVGDDREDIRITLSKNNKPIVILLHGIVGDSQSEYLYHFARELLDHGYQPVVMVARGCGGLSLTSPSLFAGSIPFDLYDVIHHIQEEYINNRSLSSSQLSEIDNSSNNTSNNTNRKIFAIGYSLGAASLFHYVSLCHNRRENAGLTAAFCISPPWCFHRTVIKPSLIGYLWSSFIALPLKLHYLSHATSLITMSTEYKTISLWDLFKVKNVGEFDSLAFHTYHKMDKHSIPLLEMEEYTTSTSGKVIRTNRRYDSVEDYYHNTSPMRMVHEVACPTLVVSAEDDPVCPHEFCPSTEYFHENLVVVKTKYGGHLGFPDRKYTLSAWVDNVVLDIIKNL